MIKFSVLLPIYQKEKPKYFEESLQSLINQTRKPNQVVIVKDGELTNELEEIIKKYQKENPNLIKIYGYKNNKGVGYALQQGVLQCDYEYIARMDSDDIAKQNRFEIQMQYIEQNPEIDILGSYIKEYDETMQKEISIRKVPLTKQEICKKIGKQSPFNHSTVILKKETVIKVGNYKPQIMEDYDLWVRMCYNNCKMLNIPEILVKFRTSTKMYKTRSGIKYIKGMLKIQKSMLEKNIINKKQYIKNLFLRSAVAIMPIQVKKYIYPKVIRKKL